MHHFATIRSHLLLVLLLLSLAIWGCARQPAALIPTPVALAGATPTVEATPSKEPAGPLPTARATAFPLPSATTLPSPTSTATPTPTATVTPSPTPTPTHPMMIEVMRRQSYPGSGLTLVETVEPGDNYERYVVSYESEGNTIYALLTVPWGTPPESGWPVIIFNHGYIPPEQYRTTERYVDYVDGFARSGYIVFRSDYRGHGNSEGEPVIAYRSPGYATDVLNGVAAVKTYPAADPNRIGMWGHSMGGFITLQAMVVSPEIRAGVIWGGVVVSIPDLFTLWRRGNPEDPTPTPDPTREERRRQFWGEWYETWGTPQENPAFWAAISPNSFLSDLSGPIQLHHARGDTSVPYIFSEMLYDQLAVAGAPGELYLYDGDNHNIAANFGTAMARSIAFFDRHVKNTP